MKIRGILITISIIGILATLAAVVAPIATTLLEFARADGIRAKAELETAKAELETAKAELETAKAEAAVLVRKQKEDERQNQHNRSLIWFLLISQLVIFVMIFQGKKENQASVRHLLIKQQKQNKKITVLLRKAK